MIEQFSNDIKEISDNLTELPQFSMEVTLTDECNFRCTYCFEGDECLNTTSYGHVDSTFAAIDTMLADDWFNANFGGIRIGFWGGEPTIRPDIIKSFVDRYKDNERIKFFIYTNGFNIDDLMDIFRENKDKIDIQVSYDGEKIHNIKRMTKGGLATAHRVKTNIYRLKSNGFTVSIKSTVTYDTLEYMVDCWEDIKAINADLGDTIKYNITLDYINPAEVDIDVVRKSFIAVAKKELSFYRDTGYHLFTWFNSEQQTRCNFFQHGFAINTSGELLYCHGCGYSCNKKDLSFGHISDDDLLDKMKHNLSYFALPEVSDTCKECISTNCVMCNVVKHEHSDKEDFLDRWYDLSCQESQCDVFKEFSKVSISLKDILRRK